MPDRFPGVVFGWVAFPFHEVVDLTFLSLPVYDLFHFVFFIVCFVLIILGVLGWFQ
jgi:hypothetical protein